MAFGSSMDFPAALQILSILLWLPLYVVLGSISIFLLVTKYWMLSVFFLAWQAYDWKTPRHGGRRSDWVRNWTLWKYFRDYFPIKLVKTCELSPSHNYIIGSHPHGIFSQGAFCNFATEATGVAQIFPGIVPSLITLERFFLFPIVREFLMAKGICPASPSAMKHLLTERGSGNAVILMVGGAAEALLAQPGKATLFLKNRKGFVRLALQTGAYLVPSYSFGENETFNQKFFPDGSWLSFIQRKIKATLGITICVFYGQGFTRHSWGFLPLRQPITTVVGEPLPIPNVEEPCQEMVDRYHALYLKALRELFDEHKAKYGISETQELVFS
ncbi:diacylglycerol O-acyltransferase 2-like protein 6 isoform X1 [Monodelphis domestica]|uniref:diacylglycerol O-acyltransferase 2-like protein 6 isoform X1 n=2 Tax=Monodelphis domestica TaxID=13616 RepID=UPI0024E1CF06|nr:diacylglycerol O-acyltransferase 2-like protein 6 isoform X1 [Monodelphis domestica]